MVHLTPSEHEAALALIGGTKYPSTKRWQHLLFSLQDSEHISWARLNEKIDPIERFPCSEEEFHQIVDTAITGRRLAPQQERYFHDGIHFIDGSTLRFLGDQWYLNDVRLSSLSFECLLPVLADVKLRTGWNISAIILGLASCSPAFEEIFPRLDGQRPARHIPLLAPYRPLGSMLLWLSHRIEIDRHSSSSTSEMIPMLAWAHDIKTKMFKNQPRDIHSIFHNALSNHPPGLFELYNLPWMRAWQTLESSDRQPRTLNWAMGTNGRRLTFRIRTKTGKLASVQIPAQPDAWALMISLVHSPINSEAGKLLLGLQHNWSVPYVEMPPPAPALVKSAVFCHEAMNGLPNRIFIEKSTALVMGKLGHFYQVNVGPGQHGAPYQIKHLWGMDESSMHPICIHSGQFTNSVPLGDTLATVLLSMANDVKASEIIDSLVEVIVDNPPFGFPSQHVPLPWLDMLDQPSLNEVRRRHRDSSKWFNPAPVFQSEALAERGGIAHYLFRNRFQRRVGPRLDSVWHGVFQNAFEEDFEFPYADIVKQWRETVKPYTCPERQEIQHPFGRVVPVAIQRYHHLMSHRREDDVHDEGDIRDGERRWCEVFARIWEVMSLQPLGSTVRIGKNDGQVVEFQHANFRATVRTRLERNTISRMARLLGYTVLSEEGEWKTFERRDHPRPDARLQLTDLLKDVQDTQGVRGAPPRWWNYCDVAAAPHAMPRLRWELQIDLTDTPRRRERRQEEWVNFPNLWIEHD